jgi:hypothetical protein
VTSPPDGEPTPNLRDDESIPNTEVLYRRLADPGGSMVAIDQVTGIRRPSSGSFKPDADGVSVYRRGLLEQNGLGPEDVITGPRNLVVGVEVGDVRSIGLGAWNDPWPTGIPDPEHPRNAAHALITGLEHLGKKTRLRRQQALVALPSIEFVYG